MRKIQSIEQWVSRGAATVQARITEMEAQLSELRQVHEALSHIHTILNPPSTPAHTPDKALGAPWDAKARPRRAKKTRRTPAAIRPLIMSAFLELDGRRGSIAQIAKEADVSGSVVARHLKEMIAAGTVKQQGHIFTYKG